MIWARLSSTYGGYNSISWFIRRDYILYSQYSLNRRKSVFSLIKLLTLGYSKPAIFLATKVCIYHSCSCPCLYTCTCWDLIRLFYLLFIDNSLIIHSSFILFIHSFPHSSNLNKLSNFKFFKNIGQNIGQNQQYRPIADIPKIGQYRPDISATDISATPLAVLAVARQATSRR